MGNGTIALVLAAISLIFSLLSFVKSCKTSKKTKGNNSYIHRNDPYNT